MAFQVAHGAGSVGAAVLIETIGYPATYLATILYCVAALLLLAKRWRAIQGSRGDGAPAAA